MPFEDRYKFDKDATNLVIIYLEGVDPNAFDLSPMIPVPTSGQFPTYAAGNFRFTGNTLRAPGDTTVKELKIDGATLVEYVIKEHPLFASVDRQLQGRSGVAKLEENDIIAKGKWVKSALDQELCSAIIAKAQSVGASYKSTPTTKWDDTSPDPIADLRAACVAVAEGCGHFPNRLQIGVEPLMWLAEYARSHFNINTTDPDIAVVEKLVLPHLHIEKVMISDARAYGGATYDDIWGDACFLYYTKKAPVKGDVTFMATLVPDDVPQYRQLPVYKDEHQTGDLVQGIEEYDVRIICEPAGHWLYNVLL